jgi:hypothetical protein
VSHVYVVVDAPAWHQPYNPVYAQDVPGHRQLTMQCLKNITTSQTSGFGHGIREIGIKSDISRHLDLAGGVFAFRWQQPKHPSGSQLGC